MKKNMFKKGHRYMLAIHILFFFICLLFILPLILVISISLSSEQSILYSGYSLFPKDFSTEAYKLAFADTSQMVYSYIVTAAQAGLGTLLICLNAGMIAYSLSRTNFAYKGPITFIVFFTMLFSGGSIPTYIIYTRYYGLADNFLIYILPGIAGGAWNTLMIRTFFKGLPESLFESAKLDGASEFKIFLRIAFPLSKPVFATVGFMTLVGKWNDWSTALVYIREEKLYSLQYLLERILNELKFMQEMQQSLALSSMMDASSAPIETLKFAMCVIAAGPMLLVFPFFQKYFVKGTTIGAVKG